MIFTPASAIVAIVSGAALGMFVWLSVVAVWCATGRAVNFRYGYYEAVILPGHGYLYGYYNPDHTKSWVVFHID